MRLHYNDYVAIRALYLGVDDTDIEEDKLDDLERHTLAKIQDIISAMEQKRKDEDAGIRPRVKRAYFKKP